MTALQLHQLDTKCLRRILSHLSLEELLKVRLVCMQFKVVVERICQARCTLKIVAYPEALEDYPLELTRFHLHDDEYLQLNAKDTVTLPSLLSLSLLGELFSTVKHLVIYFGTSERSTCRRQSHLNGRVLCLLLEQWANLFSLSLLGAIPPLTNTEHFRLSAAINGLSSLRRLNVFLGNLSPLPFTRLVPALSRLDHLSLFAYPGDISLVLRHLGPSIRHLSMQYIFPLKIYFILDELTPVLLARPHLLSSITHLRLSKVATSTMLPFITGNFVNLHVLDLEFDTQLKVCMFVLFCLFNFIII